MLRQKSVLDVFGRSPMRPLSQHMKKAQACVAELVPFYQSACDADWEKAAAVYRQIDELEHDADRIKSDLRLHLPNNLLLPVSRSDVLVLLSKQERLANRAKDIAGIILGRKLCFPDGLVDDFRRYVARAVDACDKAATAINSLDELLESGFRGKEVALIEQIIVELNAIEHETDEMQVALRQQLFQLEDRLHPVSVMFLYKMVDWVGYLADDAQQTGYQLQLLLAV